MKNIVIFIVAIILLVAVAGGTVFLLDIETDLLLDKETTDTSDVTPGTGPNDLSGADLNKLVDKTTGYFTVGKTTYFGSVVYRLVEDYDTVNIYVANCGDYSSRFRLANNFTDEPNGYGKDLSHTSYQFPATSSLVGYNSSIKTARFFAVYTFVEGCADPEAVLTELNKNVFYNTEYFNVTLLTASDTGSTDTGSTDTGSSDTGSSTPSVKLCSFTLDDDLGDVVEYYFEEGMTWEEWVESDYNVDGYFTIYGDTVFCHGSCPVFYTDPNFDDQDRIVYSYEEVIIETYTADHSNDI